MKKIATILILSIFFSALIIFSTVVTCEETNVNMIYVGGSGTDNYSSIQEAINDSSDGDSIFVYRGIYNETLIVNKSINLIGGNKEL